MKNLLKGFGIITSLMLILILTVSCDSIFGNSETDNKNSDITITNNTGIMMWYYWIKPSNSTDWGSSTSIYLKNGQSQSISVSHSLSSNSLYDVRVSYYGAAHLYTYIKYNVSLSYGTNVNFTNDDFSDGSDLPKITIQNRSGVNFDSFYLKPSAAEQWGYDFGPLSNNNEKIVTIPILLSSYSVFDIEMRRSDTTVTHSKQNVTMSNGMTIVILSTDSNSTNMELPVIVLQNNTGIMMWYYWIKPSNSTDWGSSTSIYLTNGQSQAFTLSQLLSTINIYDIRMSYYSAAHLYTYSKYNMSISDGMTLSFTDSDKEN